jgi:formamidopyrimidine-DNA glycosylase
MPELPEVENLRRGLSKSITGQKILSIQVNKPKLVSGSGTQRKESKSKARSFIQNLTSEKIIEVERKAKNLIFSLTNEKIILAHLKMTGQFVYSPNKKGKNILGGHPIEISESKLPNKHTHIIFNLSKGTLYYNDTRMFGYVLYSKNKKKLNNHFKKLGVEPLEKEFTLKYFKEALQKRKGKIKSVLLNQEIIVGIGNIYADESLFEAGVLPTRPASSLSQEEVKKLHKAIKRILKKAVAVGGSSVANYRLVDNSKGNYAREHKIYGKVGEKCKKCKKILKKTVVAGRSTTYCSTCQK